MPRPLDKYENLKRILSQMGSAVVAFSGGVDSTFLLKVAGDVLKGHVAAVTARSCFFLGELTSNFFCTFKGFF